MERGEKNGCYVFKFGGTLFCRHRKLTPFFCFRSWWFHSLSQSTGDTVNALLTTQRGTIQYSFPCPQACARELQPASVCFYKLKFNYIYFTLYYRCWKRFRQNIHLLADTNNLIFWNGHSLFEDLPTATNKWNIQSTMECVLLLKSTTMKQLRTAFN